MEQEEKPCDEVETVREFIYFGDRVSTGGGCEAAMTASTSRGWVKSRECGDWLHDRRFLPKLKWVVYKMNVGQAILHGNESRCLKESNIGILRRTEVHGECNM